jgi:hypothetical protein
MVTSVAPLTLPTVDKEAALTAHLGLRAHGADPVSRGGQKHAPHCHEPTADEQFAGSDFLDARELVQLKYEMVRGVRIDGSSVTKAAVDFGFSRPSFYAAAEALDGGGLRALLPACPGPRLAHKLTDDVVDFVEAALAVEPTRPADGSPNSSPLVSG